MIDRRQSICKIIDENIFHCYWTFGKKQIGDESLKKNYFMFFRLDRNGFRIEHCWSKLEFKLLTKERFIESIQALEKKFLNELRSMIHSQEKERNV